MPSRAVQFRSGPVALAGDLVSPAGALPAPAVALLHGTGWGERRFYRAHAAEFAAAGLVSLVFDRRGHGQSSGLRQMDVDVLAGDAMAAHAFLRAQPEVDAARVGLWGYSNGAWVAASAAEGLGDRVSFVVLTGAAGVSQAQAEVYRRTEDLRSQGIAEATLRAVEEAWTLLFGCMVTGAWDDGIVRELEALAGLLGADTTLRALPIPDFVKADPNLDSIPPLDRFPPRELLARIAGARPDLGYDPISSLAGLSCPVLVVLAERDANVPVAESVLRFEALARARPPGDVTVVVLPGADHTFTSPAASGEAPADVPGAPRTADQFISGYLRLMAQWMAAHARPTG